MKYSKIYAVFLAIGFSLAFTGAQKKLPSVAVVNQEGQTINIQEYTSSGKIQLVSLWATWCGPCRKELAALSRVYPAWKEKYDVEIIAVTVDNPRMVKRAYKMAASKGWDFTHLHDNTQALQAELGIRGIPYSLLTDRDGNVVSVSEGYYNGYEKKVEAQIAKLAK